MRLGWLIQCRVRAAPRWTHTRMEDSLRSGLRVTVVDCRAHSPRCVHVPFLLRRGRNPSRDEPEGLRLICPTCASRAVPLAIVAARTSTHLFLFSPPFFRWVQSTTMPNDNNYHSRKLSLSHGQPITSDQQRVPPLASRYWYLNTVCAYFCHVVRPAIVQALTGSGLMRCRQSGSEN